MCILSVDHPNIYVHVANGTNCVLLQETDIGKL